MLTALPERCSIITYANYHYFSGHLFGFGHGLEVSNTIVQNKKCWFLARHGMSPLVAVFLFFSVTCNGSSRLPDVASRAYGVSQSQVGPCAPPLAAVGGRQSWLLRSLAICGLLSWSASTILHSQDGEERQKRRLSHNVGRGVEMICSTK